MTFTSRMEHIAKPDVAPELISLSAELVHVGGTSVCRARGRRPSGPFLSAWSSCFPREPARAVCVTTPGRAVVPVMPIAATRSRVHCHHSGGPTT